MMYASLYPEVEPRRIDYDRMSREYPKVRGALTRARNSGDPLKVRAAVARFVALSDAVGCMPDDWAIWRNALEDAFYDWQRTDAADDDHYDNGDRELGRWREIARGFDF